MPDTVKQLRNEVYDSRLNTQKTLDFLQNELLSFRDELAGKDLQIEDFKKLIVTLVDSNINLDKKVTALMDALLGLVQQKQPQKEGKNLSASDGYSQLSRMYE